MTFAVLTKPSYTHRCKHHSYYFRSWIFLPHRYIFAHLSLLHYSSRLVLPSSLKKVVSTHKFESFLSLKVMIKLPIQFLNSSSLKPQCMHLRKNVSVFFLRFFIRQLVIVFRHHSLHLFLTLCLTLNETTSSKSYGDQVWKVLMGHITILLSDLVRKKERKGQTEIQRQIPVGTSK